MGQGYQEKISWHKSRWHPQCTKLDLVHYRPQTKFAKVMFSQVFVCPQGRGLHLGGLHPGGGSASRRGVCIQEGGLHPGGGSTYRRGVCIQEGVYIQEGGLHPGGFGQTPLPIRYCGIRSTGGWYTSYWNAFLLTTCYLFTHNIFVFSVTLFVYFIFEPFVLQQNLVKIYLA